MAKFQFNPVTGKLDMVVGEVTAQLCYPIFEIDANMHLQASNANSSNFVIDNSHLMFNPSIITQ